MAICLWIETAFILTFSVGLALVHAQGLACSLHRGRPAQAEHLSGTGPDTCGPIADGLAQPAGLAMATAFILIYPAAFVLPWRWLSALVARPITPRPGRSLALLALVLTALWDPTGYVFRRLLWWID